MELSSIGKRPQSNAIIIRIKNANDMPETIRLFDANDTDENPVNSKWVHIYTPKIGDKEPMSYQQLLKQFSAKKFNINIVRTHSHDSYHILTSFIFEIERKDGDVIERSRITSILMSPYQSQNRMIEGIINVRPESNENVLDGKNTWIFTLDQNAFIDLYLYPVSETAIAK